MEEDNENHYVAYGNALPDLEEDEASAKKLKPVPIEEQIATDDQGRRRFHGAFTGGFSAGFFNTAGSRDGWAPKHFKSSRENRFQGGSSQRPEDFMDDEDMGDFGIAPQKLQTAAKFRKEKEEANNKRKHPAFSEQLIPGEPVLGQFLKPAQETIGIRLLKEMGWKPGQGIGPKLQRSQKKQSKKAVKRLYGKGQDVEREEDSDNEDLEQYKDFLFAPDDLPNFLAKPKENLFGIGYKGLERSNVLGTGHVNLFGPEVLKFDNVDKSKKGRKMKISGQAFGVGAYEEEDDDIYQRDDMSRYDFSLEVGGQNNEDKDKKKRAGKSRWGDEINKDLVACIKGFVISKHVSNILQKRFDPPEIPKGFQPKGLKGKKSRFEQPSAEKLDTSNPTPNERRMVLAEPQDVSEEVMEQTASEDQIHALLAENFMEKDEADFKPFAKDASKQKRYEQYLVCLKNGRKNALPILQPKTMPQWEKDREKVEFERAALLFKPLNMSMSSRFVSAGSSEDADKQNEKTEKVLNESEKAVKMKLFGNLTREVVEWHPAKLLCVRFNVKPPFADPSVIGVASGTKSKFDIFGRINELPSTSKEKKEEKKDEEEKENIAKPALEVLTENANEEVVEKPPIDLFKSIFLDSASESEEDEEEDPKKELFGSELPKNESLGQKPWEEKKENVLRNPNPARGIFANIDFDRLNAKPKKMPEVVEPSTSSAGRMSAKDFFKTDVTKEAKKEDDGEQETFGPAKPVLTIPPEKVASDSSNSESSSEDEWIEKSKKKKKKHKKEKKSHKSKKKKKSSSKKKHRRKYSSSSD